MEFVETYSFEWDTTKRRTRCNLMVICDSNEGDFVQMRIWKPEGLTMREFWKDLLVIPEDRIMETTMQLKWMRTDTRPPLNQKLWLFNVFSEFENSEDFFIMDDQSTWTVVPNTRNGDEMTVVELFAGGFAGWSSAWKTIQPLMNKKVNMLAIDNDEAACKTFAISQQAALLPKGTMIKETDFAEKGNKIIWHEDLNDKKVIEAVTAIQPDMVTMSAPCPAWSGATEATGLCKPDGALMLQGLLMNRIWRPKVIAIEQVSNFNSHEHKRTIEHAIRFMGYRLVGQRVLNLDKHCQTSRCRWLALLIRVAEVEPQPTQSWPTTKRNMTNPVMRLSEEDLVQLQLDEAVKDIASRPNMLKGSGNSNRTREQTMASRLYQSDDTLPCFMAQYGNQHRLPERRLETSGYFGHFLCLEKETQNARYWHPSEIALIHGLVQPYWVDADLPTSWKLVGNCIGTPHALYLVVNALRYFDEDIDMQVAFDRYHDMKMKADECEMIRLTHGQILKNVEMNVNQDMQTAIEQLYDQFDNQQHQWWHPKQGWKPHEANMTAIDPVDSPGTEAPEIPETEPMFGCYEGFLCIRGDKYQFWYSTDLHPSDIETHWQGAYYATDCSNRGNGLEFKLQPYGADPIVHPIISVPIITEHDISIIKIDPSIPYLRQEQITEYGTMYTHEGPVDATHRPFACDVLTTQPWKTNQLKFKMLPITRAFLSCRATWTWDFEEDAIRLKLQGPRQEVQVVQEFWMNLLTKDTLDFLGRTITCETNGISFVPRSLRGGGPTDKGAKGMQKQQLQTALAAAMLEQGYPLEETKQIVDQITGRFGIHKLQTIAAQPRPAKIQSILDLCKESNIQVPTVQKPVNQENTKGMPWGHKKKRDMNFHVDPKDFQIIDGFFFNQDDTVMEIIQQPKPQASGLCVLTAKQAQQWVNNDQLLSSDELVLIALGQIQPHPNLKIAAVTFPAINPENQKVLLHGTMVQLGAKHGKHKQGDPNQISEEKCTIMSVTMFREDWSDTDWTSITHNPAAFIKTVLQADNLGTSLQSLWGKSLRNGKAPASPAQAKSCQMHCTVMDKQVKALLTKSGFNKLFFIPKDQQISGLCSRTSHALGLVRNRQGKGFGIRVEKQFFTDAWKAVHPGIDPPELREGKCTFKVTNLPYGTTKDMIDQWITKISWKAVAFRPLGPQGWIVKADQGPPDGIHMFNTVPLLITQLKDRQPKQERGTTATQPSLHSVAASAASRAASGPIETKFQEQEAKIVSLQQNMEKLAQAHTSHHAEIQQQLKTVDKKQQEHAVQVHSALKQMQSEMDKNFTLTLQQHAKSVDDKFDELKKMFKKVTKRAKPASGEDDSMSEH
eukprot:Skav206906  [mRNA]  locus=scaffold808:174759:179195:+ [translate_table: standard]